MEILTNYMTKDGKMFSDPLECEAYEKGLGIVPGSVADVVRFMEEKRKPGEYLSGLVFVRKQNGDGAAFQCDTRNIDDKLEAYVNVENLTWAQRYITTTVKDLTGWLKNFDQDCPVQYFLIFSEDIDMGKNGIMAQTNPKIWKEEEKL